MNKEDLIRKLTSRKFWAAIAGFITMLIMAFGVAQESADRVAAIVMAGASVVAYIVGEGLVDEAHAGNDAGNLTINLPAGGNMTVDTEAPEETETAEEAETAEEIGIEDEPEGLREWQKECPPAPTEANPLGGYQPKEETPGVTYEPPSGGTSMQDE